MKGLKLFLKTLSQIMTLKGFLKHCRLPVRNDPMDSSSSHNKTVITII